MAATGSPSDPMAPLPIVQAYGYRETVGRTLRSPEIIPGETTFTAVVAGQSNCGNYGNFTSVSLTNGAKIDNLNFFDGGLYSPAYPAIGCEAPGGNWVWQFADKLITGGVCQRVILAPVAVGGTFINAWANDENLFGRITIALRRLAAVGRPADAILWQQGETDGEAGTSQATWQARFGTMKGRVVAAGFDPAWFVARSTLINGVTYSAIRAAQAAVVDGVKVFAGPDTDTLTGGTNRHDNTHFTATGADAAATLWKNAVDAVI